MLHNFWFQNGLGSCGYSVPAWFSIGVGGWRVGGISGQNYSMSSSSAELWNGGALDRINAERAALGVGPLFSSFEGTLTFVANLYVSSLDYRSRYGGDVYRLLTETSNDDSNSFDVFSADATFIAGATYNNRVMFSIYSFASTTGRTPVFLRVPKAYFPKGRRFSGSPLVEIRAVGTRERHMRTTSNIGTVFLTPGTYSITSVSSTDFASFENGWERQTRVKKTIRSTVGDDYAIADFTDFE